MSTPQPAHWLDTVVYNTSMKFRTSPSTAAPFYEVGIAPDTIATVIGGIRRADGYAWVNVRYGNKDGWVALGAVT